MIFDSHAHYDDDRYNNVDDIIKYISENGVSKVMNVTSDIDSLKKSFDLACKYDMFYTSCGIHPCCVYDLDDNYIDLIKDFCKNDKVKAIGEIGLDYYYENTDRDKQKKRFKEQIELSIEMGMPIIVHCRDAYEDTINILKNYRPKSGVVHCFSGSKEIAKEFIDLGLSISFTGVVTFKNAKKSLEVLKEVPLDKLLIETDCPYMAPEPVRGSVNNSFNINYIAEKYAQIKKISKEEILKITYKNACNLFKIEN